MNRNDIVIDFRINGVHDHYIGKEKHVQPHQKKKYATKPKKITHHTWDEVEKVKTE